MIGSLHIYCGSLTWRVFVCLLLVCLLFWTFDSGNRGVSYSFACSWEPFPPSGLAHPVCALSYCILLCRIQLISLGCLFFAVLADRREEQWMREVGIWEEQRERRLQLGCVTWEKNKFKKRQANSLKQWDFALYQFCTTGSMNNENHEYHSSALHPFHFLGKKTEEVEAFNIMEIMYIFVSLNISNYKYICIYIPTTDPLQVLLPQNPFSHPHSPLPMRG